MKKLILLFGLLFMFSGCSFNEEKVEYQNDFDYVTPIEHDYSEITDFLISWEEIFNQEKELYYVYFYSETCNHCAELKNYIIEKTLEKQDIFYVKASNKVKLSEEVMGTIGAKKIEDLCILGFPSLIEIKEQICTKNVAGNIQIKDILK